MRQFQTAYSLVIDLFLIILQRFLYFNGIFNAEALFNKNVSAFKIEFTSNDSSPKNTGELNRQ